MQYPEIRFKHSWLLINTIYNDIKPAYETPKNELHKLDHAYIDRALKRYEKAWKPYEEQLIHGMCELLGLEFSQNIIDVYAAPFYNSFSDPMVIATKYTSDRSVEVVTHEIIHRLLTDNLQINDDVKLLPEWKRLFGKEHSWNTLIHIPVHVVLQALFDDVIGEPLRTTHDKKKCKPHAEYNAAWEYVDRVGYKTIIDQLRESYIKLGE